MIDPVLALTRWLQAVAGLRCLSGEQWAGLLGICGFVDDFEPLFPTVVIGVFFPHKFKTTLIDRRPDLGNALFFLHSIHSCAPPCALHMQ